MQWVMTFTGMEIQHMLQLFQRCRARASSNALASWPPWLLVGRRNCIRKVQSLSFRRPKKENAGKDWSISAQGCCKSQKVYKEGFAFCSCRVDCMGHWALGSTADDKSTVGTGSALQVSHVETSPTSIHSQATALDAPALKLSRAVSPLLEAQTAFCRLKTSR